MNLFCFQNVLLQSSHFLGHGFLDFNLLCASGLSCVS